MTRQNATADLYDELEERVQSLSLQLTDFGGLRRFSGPIRTVECFEDNAIVKAVLSGPGDGAVLVVAGGGSLQSALMGDIIARSALDNGWSGVVIHGAIRDSVAIGEMSLGVKALGTNPRKSAKTGAGLVNTVIQFGQIVFTPGRTIWCDEDGVLVERP